MKMLFVKSCNLGAFTLASLSWFYCLCWTLSALQTSPVLSQHLSKVWRSSEPLTLLWLICLEDTCVASCGCGVVVTCEENCHPWWIRSILANVNGEELLRDLFGVCPFYLPVLLSFSGCRVNLCLFIAAAAELNYGSVCWGGAAVAAWHIIACLTEFMSEVWVVGGQQK